ncbi:hypothetical protein HDU96_003889 [Phlyctochytrium bullatum]|nr:hypothetical protein HDU96_003889 [Phlyctochytrium bullatum]
MARLLCDHVWSNYQLERFKAANAGAVIVSSADVDVEGDAVKGNAYPRAASTSK